VHHSLTFEVLPVIGDDVVSHMENPAKSGRQRERLAPSLGAISGPRRALSRLLIGNGDHGDLMSLFDRVRRIRVRGVPSDTLAGSRLRRVSAVAGASAALVSMLIIAAPVVLAWVASPQSTVGWPRALSVGTSLWLLVNGAQLSSGPATISLTPLLLTTIPLVIATIAARRIFRQFHDGRPGKLSRWGGVRRDVAGACLFFICAYAAVGLVVALVTVGEPLHASALSSAVGTAVVGMVSVLFALALEFRGQMGSVAPDLAEWFEDRVPIHLRRAIRPGLWGALAVFGAGLALTVVMVVAHLGRIGRLDDALGADPVGLVMLSLGQLTVLPNVGLWAASWMSGPGFGLGEGTAITWSHSNPGLLPLIPGLGAVPAPGPLPAGMWLSVMIPVAAGCLVGWRSLRVVARLSSLRAKAETAGSACLLSSLVLTLATALAGGSLGAARLSGLGAPSLLFGATVLGELLLGAAIVVGLSHLRAFRS
jgi:hypothetical protein